MTDSGPSASPDSGVNTGYHVFMLVLCLYALLALGAETVLQLTPATRNILDAADLVVCALFFADFVISWRAAPDRWRYMRTWGWLDLISSIPAIGLARLGRLARVVRIVRLMRGLRIAKVGMAMLGRHRARNAVLAASLATLFLVVVAAIAVLQFEVEAHSTIRTSEEALWWAVTTLTTVGYGDLVPVTSGGRAVATVLMVAGVGLFGILSGLLASWFVGTSVRVDRSELDAIRAELAALREAMTGRGDRGEGKD